MEQQSKTARRDRQMKAEGMTVRVDAYVQPEEGGDAYLIGLYYPRRPKVADIEATLRTKGSVVLTTYQVTTL